MMHETAIKWHKLGQFSESVVLRYDTVKKEYVVHTHLAIGYINGDYLLTYESALAEYLFRCYKGGFITLDEKVTREKSYS